MQIRMSDNEQLLFKAFADRASGYFEFGTGGSTVYAARAVRGPLVAIDSDPAWIDDVSRLIEDSPHSRRLVHVDIGKTGDWGYPLEPDRRADFPRYPAAVVDCGDAIDLCLVDGRFRVACFLQALKCLRPDAVLGMHDFESRAHYHVVRDFSREIATVEDMAFFVRRPSIDRSRLDQVLQAHLADAR